MAKFQAKLESLLEQSNVLKERAGQLSKSDLYKEFLEYIEQASTLQEDKSEELVESMVATSVEKIIESNTMIMAFGAQNSGKSSLLNVLCGDYTMQSFKVSDTRETIEKKQIAHQGRENIFYIDTPGLNANDDDTSVAREALREADIVLFVHNPNNGELDKAELESLEHLQAHFGDFVSECCIVVLTRLGEIDSARVKRVKEKVATQIHDALGQRCEIIAIDSKSYAKAKLEKKKALESSSNVAALLAALDKKLEKVQALKAKRRKVALNNYHKETSMLIDELKAVRDGLQGFCDTFNTEVEAKISRAKASLENLY